jgi:hypothetical protein
MSLIGGGDSLIGGGGGSASGLIQIKHSNGSVSGYYPSADTDVSRGTKLKEVIAAIVAGEEIILSGNTYDTGTTYDIAVPKCTIRGSGKNSTIIKSEGTNLKYTWKLASECILRDLQMDFSQGGAATFPIGDASGTNDGIAFSCPKGTVHSCKFIGSDADVFRFANDSSVLDWRFYDCEFSGMYDMVASTAGAVGSIIRCYNCTFDGTATGNTTSAIRCGGNGKFFFYDCEIYKGGSDVAEIYVGAIGQDAAELYFFGGLISITGSGGTYATIALQDTANAYFSPNVKADLSASMQMLLGTGTVQGLGNNISTDGTLGLASGSFNTGDANKAIVVKNGLIVSVT